MKTKDFICINYAETVSRNDYILPMLEHFNDGPPSDLDFSCVEKSSTYTLIPFKVDYVTIDSVFLNAHLNFQDQNRAYCFLLLYNICGHPISMNLLGQCRIKIPTLDYALFMESKMEEEIKEVNYRIF